MEIKTHHVALTVNNIEESIQWYKEMLGFEIEHSYDKNGMHFVFMTSGKVRIELFHFEGNNLPLPHHSTDVMKDLHVVGTKHLCIEVDNLDKTIHHLKEKGVVFATEKDTAAFGGEYIFCKDCNGILIELFQN